MIRLIVVLMSAFLLFAAAHARDPEGKYANSPLKDWFDHLSSKNGNCCSFADGRTIEDVDWTTDNGHYRVRFDGEWYDVPDDALVTVPNKYGKAVVWPYVEFNTKQVKIRCFMPGALT